MNSCVNTANALGGAFLLPRDRATWPEKLRLGTKAGEQDQASLKAPVAGKKLSAEELQVQAIAELEASWVRSASRGSMAAFEQIVLRYQRPVISLIARKVRDTALAEDLAQETFLKAHRALHTFDTSRRLASWLFKIANNTAIDHLRRKQLPTQALDNGDDDRRSLIDTLEDGDALPADRRVEGQQLGQILQRALCQLRDDYREVLTLRFVEGLSYLEVAEVTDQPLGTVKTKIHRARRDLAALMENPR